LNGEPITNPVSLVLEDQNFRAVQQITTTNGEYLFYDLPASESGYNVVFSQDLNTHLGYDEVASWVWIGPLPVQDGDTIDLPNMEIGLPGLLPVYPSSDSILKLGPITSQNPLVFEWTSYPGESQYWLELRASNTLQVIWQSGFLDSPTVSFDGNLINGDTIRPGSYWWSVSVRLADTKMTISGPLRSFYLTP
jgi:hypothetical protein